MKVRVEYIGHVKNVTANKKEEELVTQSNSRVIDLLNMLTACYGEPFRKTVYEAGDKDVKPNYIVTVNGYLLNQLQGLDTKLKNGDRVAILPVVSGG